MRTLNHKHIGLLTAVVISISILTLSLPAISADQPQWGERNTRNMVSPEKGLPDSFDIKSGKNVLWSETLGTESYATPVVAQGKVMIGTNNKHPRDPKHTGDRGVLMCFNEKNGKFLWQLLVPKLTGDMYLDWPYSGLCSPPTVEGDRAWVFDNRCEMLCIGMDGQAAGNKGPYLDDARHMTPADETPQLPGSMDADILWLFDLVSGAGTHPHDQAHSSALIFGDQIYFNSCNGVDNTHRRIRSPEAPSLLVLDKNTGKYLARDYERIGPKVFHNTWSAPALGMVNGRPEIIFCGGDGVVYAFEPYNGISPVSGTEPAALKKIWQFDPDPTGPKVNVSEFLGNRREGPSTIHGSPVFYKNRIYIAGGGDIWWGKEHAWLKCIDATKTGDITKGGELWSAPLSMHTLATPAIHNGLIFITDCGGKVRCVDAETGKVYWTHETQSEFWGSCLVADGKVYTGNRRGEFFVFAESKEKKLVFSTELGDPISATPVAANGTLYVTTMTRIYALRK